jgi:F-type H+-transporting ATPase subunit delta
MAVAQRMYARALFEAAKEKERLPEVREQLGDFLQASRDVPELGALLGNPQLDTQTKARALEDLLGDADEIVRNFLMLVAEKGRVGELDEIEREFERLVAADEGRLEVELTTAYELSDEEAAAIVRQIEQASGRKVEAKRKVDADLIGGMILQVGSLRLDASVRGRLNKLRQTLTTRR